MRDALQATEFVQLLTSHQQLLYVYLLRFLPHPADADEVLQETNLAIWSNAEKFRPGASFVAWAERIAYFQVLTFRKRNTRNRLRFANDLLETFAEEAGCDAEVRGQRRVALAGCLDKLSDRDRDLVARRYASSATVQQIASEANRPLSSVYRSLERIHLALLGCIRRTLAAQEGD